MGEELSVQAQDELARREAGQIANVIAAKHAFRDYRERKAVNTRNAQDHDLQVFAEYLKAIGLAAGNLVGDPQAWRGITWGIVIGFVRWQLTQDYAAGSVNRRLSTVKVYASLAAQAGEIETQALALINTVTGYSRKEAKRVDQERPATRKRVVRVRQENGLVQDVRRTKKASPVSLTLEQADALKAQPDDMPKGRRDGLIMALLLDHGLRASELCELQVGDFDLKRGTFTFFREKVDKAQTHRLQPAARQAAKKYFDHDASPVGRLLRRSKKNNELGQAGLTRYGLAKVVSALGKEEGIWGLSPHDCRHYWATQAARAGTPMDRLQDAGGWASIAMPARYIESAKIANEGVVLEEGNDDEL